MPLPFLIRAYACDAGNEGAFVNLSGQGCVDMNNGYLYGGHRSLRFPGHWSLGIGHWSLGIGHWVLGIGVFAYLVISH